MKQRIPSFTLAIGFAAMTAAPATAQMWNFPDYMVPGMREAPTSCADYRSVVSHDTSVV